MKEYVSPTVELIEFQDNTILASSTGCKCFGEVIQDLHEVLDDNDCWATTYDNMELVQAKLPW